MPDLVFKLQPVRQIQSTNMKSAGEERQSENDMNQIITLRENPQYDLTAIGMVCFFEPVSGGAPGSPLRGR